MTYGSQAAPAAIPVWVALSDNGGAHADAARALRAEVERALPGRVAWKEGHWSRFDAQGAPPHWIVAIGHAAHKGMQELSFNTAAPPLLAILVPRLAFERTADPARLRAGTLSAVYLDQPPGRQLDLIRIALPAARGIGIVVGEESAGLAVALARAARERGMPLATSSATKEGLFPALQKVLADADVLLALPDPAVFNSQTAANILLAAYRRQVPLVGFSPAYVKAGALLALYSTPAQAGTRGGELLRQAIEGRALPPPQWPREFAVGVNADVARSLGLGLDEARLYEQLRQKERP